MRPGRSSCQLRATILVADPDKETKDIFGVCDREALQFTPNETPKLRLTTVKLLQGHWWWRRFKEPPRKDCCAWPDQWATHIPHPPTDDNLLAVWQGWTSFFCNDEYHSKSLTVFDKRIKHQLISLGFSVLILIFHSLLSDLPSISQMYFQTYTLQHMNWGMLYI